MNKINLGLSRRTFLENLTALAGAAAFGMPLRGLADGGTTLASMAGVAGLLYGACSRGLIDDYDESTPVGAADPDFAQLFLAQCGMLVAERETIMSVLRPKHDVWNWWPVQALFDYAQQNDLQFRGHALVWGEGVPNWVPYRVHQKNAEQFLTDHVTAVCSRFAAGTHSWTVVNEPIDTTKRGDNGLKKSTFERILGERYIDVAFNAAHAADPDALLLLSDYGLEYDCPYHEERRQAMLALLARLLDRGVPIHAVGIESHLIVGQYPFSADILIAFFEAIAAMGLKIFITELDAPDNNLPADTGTRDQGVANEISNYLNAALTVPAVTSVVTWGLSDRYDWLNASNLLKRRDGQPSRSLPFDADLLPKPAFDEITKAFGVTPYRSG